MDVKLHVFLTSGVNGSESSASHPGGFSPVKGTPICQLMKRLGGSQNRPERSGKNINIFFFAGNQIPISKPLSEARCAQEDLLYGIWKPCIHLIQEHKHGTETSGFIRC